MADYYGSLNRIAESIAYEETIVESKIDEYAARNSIVTATGEYLDKIGNDLFGIPRLAEQRIDISQPMKVLKFYVDIGVFGDINRGPSGLPEDIIVPAGTNISGLINGINYLFSTDVPFTLGINESEKYISGIMIQGDTTLIPTNTLTSHTFTGYSTGISKLLKVTNPAPISTGRQKETDENYRYRISKGLRSHLTSTYFGIENTLLSVPGVSNVDILNATSGGGTFTVFVQGTTPVTSDDVISRCDSALKRSLPPWVAFNVLKPYYIGLDCILNVTVTQKSDTIASNVVNAVSDLINNFGGSEFYVNTILQTAAFADPNILTVSFEQCRKHSGSESYRTYTDIFTGTNPVIPIYQLQKLIVEQTPNAIVVNQII
jgi:Baseplate J-like protein